MCFRIRPVARNQMLKTRPASARSLRDSLTMRGVKEGMEGVMVTRVLVLLLASVVAASRRLQFSVPGSTPAFGSSGVPVVTYPAYRLTLRRLACAIIVFGQDNLSQLYNVDTAGRIAFPLIGNVAARGLTTSTARQRESRASSEELHQGPQGQRRGRRLKPVLHPGRGRQARRNILTSTA